MTTNSIASAAALSTATLNATPSPASARGISFDQQLSQALSESLQKLGVTPGEINISIKSSAGNLTSRQILITYSGADTAPGAAAAADPAFTAAPRNPFSGNDPAPQATPTVPDVPQSTDWCPWDGPRDKHDAIPTGGGKVSSSGAPLIKANSSPVSNQYNYAGPAALNPYFTTPSNPLREGYVLGFNNWFEDAQILGSKNGPTTANRSLFSTEEGAKEALRLVQQYAPGAEIVQRTWGGGPFTASKPTYLISVGDGKTLNAGGVLTSYYYGGRGVTAQSDADLARSVQMA